MNDWQKNTIYRHYTKNSKQIQWFWQVSPSTGSASVLLPSPGIVPCPRPGAGRAVPGQAASPGCQEERNTTASTCSAGSIWLWLAEAPAPPLRTAGST